MRVTINSLYIRWGNFWHWIFPREKLSVSPVLVSESALDDFNSHKSDIISNSHGWFLLRVSYNTHLEFLIRIVVTYFWTPRAEDGVYALLNWVQEFSLCLLQDSQKQRRKKYLSNPVWAVLCPLCPSSLLSKSSSFLD